MNINRVVLSGNLTRDPELRQTGGGSSVCKLGIAVNTRRKDSSTGEWEDKPNFFRVTVFGRQGENCSQYLEKGRGVMIDGRLEWSQWETDGQRRESVEIVAENVQFIGGPREGGNGSSRSGSDIPIDTGGLAPAPPVGADEEIPF